MFRLLPALNVLLLGTPLYDDGGDGDGGDGDDDDDGDDGDDGYVDDGDVEGVYEGALPILGLYDGVDAGVGGGAVYWYGTAVGCDTVIVLAGGAADAYLLMLVAVAVVVVMVFGGTGTDTATVGVFCLFYSIFFFIASKLIGGATLVLVLVLKVLTLALLLLLLVLDDGIDGY